MITRLLYSTFFPARDGQAWRYYLAEWVKDFPWVLQAMYQRATRGWAWCDTWSIDIWFQHVVPDMLRYLSETTHGTPMKFFPDGMLDNPNIPIEDLAVQHEEWTKVLLQIARDLEAHERFWDEVTYEDISHEDFVVEENKAYEKVSDGVAAFKTYFYDLWD